jgi:hypothetical protein
MRPPLVSLVLPNRVAGTEPTRNGVLPPLLLQRLQRLHRLLAESGLLRLARNLAGRTARTRHSPPSNITIRMSSGRSVFMGAKWVKTAVTYEGKILELLAKRLFLRLFK